MSSKIEDMFIPNPYWRFVFFPLCKEKHPNISIENRVLLCILYTKVSDEILLEISKQLNLTKPLDWYYFGGRIVLYCDAQDIFKVYDIVTKLISYTHVYMNDGTQITFDSSQVPSLETQQKQLLETFKLNETHNPKNPLEWGYRSIPAHRTAFWSILEGKEYAKHLCKLLNRQDVYDDKSIGEYFAEENKDYFKLDEKISKSNNDILVQDMKDEAPEAPEIKECVRECVICLDQAPSTLVLPCLHCVVCSKCSQELSNDPNNSKKCVYCRQDILQVLDNVDAFSK